MVLEMAMKVLILVALMLCAAFANAADLGLKRVYFPQASFDAKSAQQDLASGSSSIRGVAYVNDPMGTGTYYARGSVVMLFPVSDYFAEWMRLTDKFRNTQHDVYMLPDVFAARKEAVTDGDGNFVFDRLKPGKYFLETIVDYQSTGVASQQSGTVVGVMGGAAYSYPTYSHYTYRFDAQKRVTKVIEIERDGQMVPVKLRPGFGLKFGVGGLAALAGSSSLCYQKGNMQYGTCKDFHPNGRVKIEAEWKAHQFDGAYREYDDKGHLLATGEFEQGRKTGEWSFYSPDNAKTPRHKERYGYINGKVVPNGDSEYYYPDGSIRQIDHYVDGDLELSSRFYPGGKLNWRTEYKAGVPDGVSVYFDESGVEKNRRVYSDGKLISEVGVAPK